MEAPALEIRPAQLAAVFKTLIVDPVHEREARDVMAKIRSPMLWAEYLATATLLGGFIPPWFIGCLHYRENTSLSLNAFLGNGQLIIGSGRRSTIVPIGRGPFRTFHEGAVDALKEAGFEKFISWSPGECLARAERWNGLGYMHRGVPNPYLFAGTNAYSRGKYGSDGNYDPNLIDKELGFACLMKAA